MYDNAVNGYDFLALTKKEITKMCKDAWKEMDKEDKKEFIEKHSDDLKDKKKKEYKLDTQTLIDNRGDPVPVVQAKDEVKEEL